MVKMNSARLFGTTVLLAFLQSAYAFGHVPGSPCTEVCSGNPQDTLANDVVCLDADYVNSTSGKPFYDCITCELNSTAVDRATNQSDVEWGLRMITLDSSLLGHC
jgi:hypothetical protein